MWRTWSSWLAAAGVVGRNAAEADQMSELHLTWVDIGVAVILILSTWIAIARGFVRETLSIFAWAAAAIATLYFGRYAVSLLTPHAPMLVADVVGYTAVFLLVLIPLALISSGVSRQVHASPAGGLDRILGALFGIGRGLAAIAILYILYSLIIPVPVQARWMKDARTLPLIQKSATTLLSLLPERDAHYVQEQSQGRNSSLYGERSPAQQSASKLPARTDMPSVPAAAVGHKVLHKSYGADERRRLNRLIEATGHGQ
jgi:membrane protein required for colicin V production